MFFHFVIININGGTFPEILKHSTVIPLHKSLDTTNVNNHKSKMNITFLLERSNKI